MRPGHFARVKWLERMPCKLGVWRSKPTQTLCALPHSGVVDRTQNPCSLKVGSLGFLYLWQPVQSCGTYSLKGVRDVAVDGPVTVLRLFIG